MTFRTFENYTIIGAWVIFLLLFVTRKKASTHAPHADKKRDRRAIIGMLFQGVGYMAVWTVRRRPSANFILFVPIPEIIVFAAAMAIMAASIAVTYWAVETLGKQWSLAARLINDHQLVTVGPYGCVRHPSWACSWPPGWC